MGRFDALTQLDDAKKKQNAAEIPSTNKPTPPTANSSDINASLLANQQTSKEVNQQTSKLVSQQTSKLVNQHASKVVNQKSVN